MEKPLASSNPMLHFQIRTPSTGVRPPTTWFHGLLRGQGRRDGGHMVGAEPHGLVTVLACHSGWSRRSTRYTRPRTPASSAPWPAATRARWPVAGTGQPTASGGSSAGRADAYAGSARRAPRGRHQLLCRRPLLVSGAFRRPLDRRSTCRRRRCRRREGRYPGRPRSDRPPGPPCSSSSPGGPPLRTPAAANRPHRGSQPKWSSTRTPQLPGLAALEPCKARGPAYQPMVA